MEPVIVAVLLLLAVGGAAAAAWSWWQREGAWRSLAARRVVVNLHGGDAVLGVLVARRGPLLFLRDASHAGGAENPVPIDGEAVIERSEIDFIQHLND